MSDHPLAEHGGRPRDIGNGPYARMLLRDVTVVDGTGSPPFGPADVVVDGAHIAEIFEHARPFGRLQSAERPQPGPRDMVFDLAGHWVMPGFVDCHVHISPPAMVPSAQYIYDLWLAHGVTTVRDAGGLEVGSAFVVNESRRSAANEIAAPRIVPYAVFGEGRQRPITDPEEARRWVGEVAERGVSGVKFFGGRPDVFEAALAELRRLGKGSACHHAQTSVASANAIDTSRWGLGSIEHGYGIPEAMFVDRRIQRFPAGYNQNSEQARFAGAGALWAQAAEPHSSRWEEVVDELAGSGTSVDPTFGIYSGMRDAARVQSYRWNTEFGSPRLLSFWQPGEGRHGSFFHDWTTDFEANWRRDFVLWMEFIREYFYRRGKLVLGTDAGSVWKLYGFSYIEEMELFREAGLSALETIHCATLAGARLLGIAQETGSVEVGKRADLVVTSSDPLTNFKIMYGRLAPSAAGDPGAASGIRLVLKDGVVYSPAALLGRVRAQVQLEEDRNHMASVG